jgi:hypothetical protein
MAIDSYLIAFLQAFGIEFGTDGISGVHDVHNEADTNDLNHLKDMHLSDIPELDVILIGASFSAFTLPNRYVIVSVYQQGLS